MIFTLLLSGCSGSQTREKQSNGPHRLQVATTFYPMYYFAKQVAGNSADVTLLIPNGVEPHDWEPTAKDMALIQNADVFIYNSRYFETWVDKVLKSIDTTQLKVVEAAGQLPLMDTDGKHSSKDPHVWLSPVLAQKETEQIAMALIQKDPKNKLHYEANTAAFKKKLAKLDQAYKESIAKASHKEFITQHAAFGYLAKQYGLKQISIAGLSPDTEPTLGKLAELADLAKSKNLKVIYFEGMASSKVAKALANEIHAKTEVLNPLEGLTKEDQKQGLDYLGVMEKNLNSLKKSIY